MRLSGSGCKRTIGLLLAAMILSLCTACGSAERTGPLIGRWAFEGTEDEVLRLNADGSAVWQKKSFTWTDSGEALTLTPASGDPVVIRYKRDDGGFRIWPVTVYAPSAASQPDGLVGAWYVEETPRVSFIFRADGTFAEDTAFSGTYTVDPEAGTFRLDYGGLFDPVVCGYALRDGKLEVAYPWVLVPCP